MTSNSDLAANIKNTQVLPVIVLQSSIIFPSTLLEMSDQFEKQTPPKLLADGTKFFALKNNAQNAVGLGRLWKVGCICLLQKNDENYQLNGKSRAAVESIWRDKKLGLVASVRELEDIPSVEDITDAELPMLFGCVESIRLFLKKWREKIPESETELHKKISKQIAKIEAGRREREIIYTLPWHILVIFYNFFSQDFKEEMLRTDKVIDRLQSIAEKLQLEISAFRHAGSFADTECLIQLEGWISGK